MTVFLGSREIADIVEPELALAAARRAVQAESEGRTALLPRIDVNVDTGFLRIMPAAIDGVMGAKVMTLVRGVGNRYLLLLYSQQSGALLAIPSEVTRLRTAAVTVLAGELLRPERAARLTIIGSGFEAAGHLRAFAAARPLAEARAFSPSAARCRAFAEQISTELAIPVAAAESAAAPTAGVDVTVVATKSEAPVGRREPVRAWRYGAVDRLDSARPARNRQQRVRSSFTRACGQPGADPRGIRRCDRRDRERSDRRAPIVAMAEAAGDLRPIATAPRARSAGVQVGRDRAAGSRSRKGGARRGDGERTRTGPRRTCRAEGCP